MSAQSSRRIIRGCFEPSTSLMARIVAAVTEPIDFVMEQRMLRTLKRLAERQPGGRPTLLE